MRLIIIIIIVIINIIIIIICIIIIIIIPWISDIKQIFCYSDFLPTFTPVSF